MIVMHALPPVSGGGQLVQEEAPSCWKLLDASHSERGGRAEGTGGWGHSVSRVWACGRARVRGYVWRQGREHPRPRRA